MNNGVPWQVRGVRPQARDTAREAARRAGVSVGEWLEEVIASSANEEGVAPQNHYADPEYGAPEDGLSAVNARLDDLSRQLGQIARSGGGPGAQHDTGQIAHAIARLDRRLDQIVADQRPTTMAELYRDPSLAESAPDSVEAALAEITARQQALDHNPASAPLPYTPAPPSIPAHAMYAPPDRRPAPPPPQPRVQSDVLPRPATQDLSGLEQHLRQITSQIETLRNPTAIAESITALREELGEISRTIQEAMPRRAVEALENEVRSLATKLNQSRSSDVDGNALAALEHGILEVRDELRSLTPAESLGGLQQTIENLAYKIDAIATGRQDPGTLHQLEDAVETLKSVVAHVASNDALGHLIEEMRALALKVDRLAKSGTTNEVLTAIDQRIDSLARALEARSAVVAAEDPSPRIEAVVQGLTDKLERLAQSHGGNAAVGHLEERIAKLVEKLDASGARLNHLEAIEHALAELLVHLEQQRAQNAAAPRAERRAGPAPEVETIQRELETIKQVEQRNQDAIEAAHGTLGHVVDRLAMIETDMQAPPAPAARPRAVAVAQIQEPKPKFAPPPMTAEWRPIDPNLPPDHPLEPGLGASPGRAGPSPADRIAASEAALGSAKPPVIPDPGSKDDFIQAARRAARAASATAHADAAANAPRAELRPARPPENEGGGFAKRVRSLFVGASVVSIVLGTLYATAELIGPASEAVKSVSPTIGSQAPATTEQAGIEPTTPAAAPVGGQSAASNGDITGSIGAAPAAAARAKLEALPVGIGSDMLRNAARDGDPAAAFEVAMRFLDGRGVPQNAAEAARWFQRATEGGLVPAQFRLGGLYEKGIGVKKDLDAARRLYLLAANAGHGKAMHNLAVLFAEGIDGKPDFRNALQWFRKAAALGVMDSQFNLAVLSARGVGMPQNLAESYKWFALAARDGDKDAAKKRDDVAARLDAASLEAARLAVQTFTPALEPQAAIDVPAPAGGWDAPAAAKRAANAGGPLRPAAPKRPGP